MSADGLMATSNAFFPFRDGVDQLAGYGVTAIIQPGGSVRDEEVIQACDEHGIAMVFTGHRHFRHCCFNNSLAEGVASLNLGVLASRLFINPFSMMAAISGCSVCSILI
ncbi:MAG: hypothetical protein ACLRX5_08995 [Slackia sp.]